MIQVNVIPDRRADLATGVLLKADQEVIRLANIEAARVETLENIDEVHERRIRKNGGAEGLHIVLFGPP